MGMLCGSEIPDFRQFLGLLGFDRVLRVEGLEIMSMGLHP